MGGKHLACALILSVFIGYNAASERFRRGDNSGGHQGYLDVIKDGVDSIQRTVQDGLKQAKNNGQGSASGYGGSGNEKVVYTTSKDGKSGGYAFTGTLENGGYGGGGGYSRSH